MYFESLESRKFLAGTPVTLDGLQLNFTVTSGQTGDLGNRYGFRMNGGPGTLYGDLLNAAGKAVQSHVLSSYTWAYPTYDTGVASLTVTSFTPGYRYMGFTLSFYNGTYQMSDSAYGTQQGTFAAVPLGSPVAPFASIQDGDLVINGSSKADTIAILPSGTGIKVRRNREYQTITGTFNDIWIYAGRGDDKIDLTQSPRPVYYVGGGAGNDIAYGSPYFEAFYGDTGNDTFYGNNGNDVFYGEAGDDTFDGGRGNDDGSGGEGNDTLAGGDGNDELNGSYGHDTILGGAGDDTITGGDGNDFIRGGDGHDRLDGDDGKDQIWGDTGNDTLRGGIGLDWFSGGRGEDLYGDRDSREVIDWL